ncbi:MAG: hypothetical protein OK455_10550 [Thaumarchaeota archaeon]|nr:hypothetical protein [Nitrososphaerota archaeon]
MIPANTLVWTTWTINNTISMAAAQANLLAGAQNVNSTITIAVYINGQLAAHESDRIPSVTLPGQSSPSPVEQTVTITVPMPSGTTLTPGTIVSLAFISSTDINDYFTGTPGVPTLEASVQANSGLPSTLPSPTSTVTSTMEIWAYALVR